MVLLVFGWNSLQATVDEIMQNVSSDLSSVGAEARATAPPSWTSLPSTPAPPAAGFAPIPLSGTGNAVPRFAIPETAVGLADITHSGGANFAVWTVGADGQEQELLVNAIGGYTGTVLFNVRQHAVAFKVDAGGAWSITVKPLASAFHWDQTQAVTGTGDDVVLLDPATSGLTSVTITHRGSSNFAVWAYGDRQDLLVNEIGEYRGESLLASGTVLLQINADGGWSVTPPS